MEILLAAVGMLTAFAGLLWAIDRQRVGWQAAFMFVLVFSAVWLSIVVGLVR